MVVTDPDDGLTDAALAEEIVVLGDVMAAAADIGGRKMSQAEVDQALGLTSPESAGRRRGRSTRRRHHHGHDR